jgi:hypothetical protein
MWPSAIPTMPGLAMLAGLALIYGQHAAPDTTGVSSCRA